MSTGFYTNYSDIKFIDKLKKSIDTCDAFYFSVSFIKKPGLKLVAPNIEAALARGARGKLITTTRSCMRRKIAGSLQIRFLPELM